MQVFYCRALSDFFKCESLAAEIDFYRVPVADISSQPPPIQTNFLLYRLLSGISETLNIYLWIHGLAGAMLMKNLFTLRKNLCLQDKAVLV